MSGLTQRTISGRRGMGPWASQLNEIQDDIVLLNGGVHGVRRVMLSSADANHVVGDVDMGGANFEYIENNAAASDFAIFPLSFLVKGDRVLRVRSWLRDPTGGQVRVTLQRHSFPTTITESSWYSSNTDADQILDYTLADPDSHVVDDTKALRLGFYPEDSPSGKFRVYRVEVFYDHPE